MLKAYLFPSYIPIPSGHKEWFRTAGYELAHWPGGACADASILLLVAPVNCSNQLFIHPEHVWRKYFIDKMPDARIIQTGLREQPQTTANYLHWFFLPATFQQLANQLKPLPEMEFIPSLGFPTFESIWKRFWDGHDKGGFFYYFSNAETLVKVAAERLQENPEAWRQEREFLLEVELDEFLTNCQDRWAHYSPYWEALPFPERMTQIKQAIKAFKLNAKSLTQGVVFAARLHKLNQQIAFARSTFDEIAEYFKN